MGLRPPSSSRSRARTAAVGALVLLVCALGWSAATAAAKPQSILSSSGPVAATLTYEEAAATGAPSYSQEHLQISRLGAGYYEAPVSSHFCPSGCALETAGNGPLSLADLEGDGEPAVVLQLNTDGAHCCGIVQIFSFDPSKMAYREIERDFGDPGARIVDVAGDGRLELLSADDRFAYEFAPYAYSPLPLQIWELRAGRLIDATRDFPKQLAADASRQFRLFLFNRRLGLGLGCIAAWAADEELLGHGRAVSRVLARELHHHRLLSHDSINHGGSAFVSRLKGFLKKTAYIAG
ncbi:MAG: hypothetical protein ACYDHN_04555 [Solirubrobacteraceae bacterium]